LDLAAPLAPIILPLSWTKVKNPKAAAAKIYTNPKTIGYVRSRLVEAVHHRKSAKTRRASARHRKAG